MASVDDLLAECADGDGWAAAAQSAHVAPAPVPTAAPSLPIVTAGERDTVEGASMISYKRPAAVNTPRSDELKLPRSALHLVAQQVRTAPSKGFEEAKGRWRANGADDVLARERVERGYTSFSDKPFYVATRSRVCVCQARPRGHTALDQHALVRCVREGWGSGSDADDTMAKLYTT